MSWTDNDQEALLRHQKNYYGAMDVATKPIQWFMSAITMLFAIVLFGCIALIYPIYNHFKTGVDINWFFVGVGLWLLFLLPVFLCCFGYTCLTGIPILIYIFFVMDDKSGYDPGLRMVQIFAVWEIIGVLILFKKITNWLMKRRRMYKETGKRPIYDLIAVWLEIAVLTSWWGIQKAVGVDPDKIGT